MHSDARLGAAGLVASSQLKQLCEEDGEMSITIYEASSHLGGIWNYQEKINESVRGCKLGIGSPWFIDGDSKTSGIYPSLKTNLPHVLMQFRDIAFDLDRHEELVDSACDVNSKSRSVRKDDNFFVPHTDVLRYLIECAEKWDVTRYIKFNHSVINVEKVDHKTWSVQIFDQRKSRLFQEEFDYVLVANGHFTDTNLPQTMGVQSFPHQIQHSISYRHPQLYSHKTVLVVGTSWSGQDLVREISQHACKIYWSSRSGTFPSIPKTANLERIEFVGEIIKFNEDGSVETKDGYEFNVAHVIFATGYSYSFPFLPFISAQTKDSVPNLEMQMFYKPDPSLMFLGLARNVSFLISCVSNQFLVFSL
jgi:cation diffusion facilitator CzcD-associated flavoprotein CzcO